MNKLLPYMLLLGATILIGLGWGQQKYIENLTSRILPQIEEAETLFHENNIAKSSYIMDNVVKQWESSEKWLGIMMSHENFHRISQNLIETDNKLKNFLNSHNISSNFALLKMYIKNMEEENEFVIENVL